MELGTLSPLSPKEGGEGGGGGGERRRELRGDGLGVKGRGVGGEGRGVGRGKAPPPLAHAYLTYNGTQALAPRPSPLAPRPVTRSATHDPRRDCGTATHAL